MRTINKHNFKKFLLIITAVMAIGVGMLLINQTIEFSAKAQILTVGY